MRRYLCFGERRRNEEPGKIKSVVSETNSRPPQRQMQPQNTAIPDALKDDVAGANTTSGPGTAPYRVQNQPNPNFVANPAHGSSRNNDAPTRSGRQAIHDHPLDDSMDQDSQAIALFNGQGVPPEGQGPRTIRHELAADVPANNEQRDGRLPSSEQNIGQQSETGERNHSDSWLEDAEEATGTQKLSIAQRLRIKKRPPSPDQGPQESFLAPEDAKALKEFCDVHELSKEMRQIAKVLPLVSKRFLEISEEMDELKCGLRHKDAQISALRGTIELGGKDRRALESKIREIEREKGKEIWERDMTIRQKDETIAQNSTSYNGDRIQLVHNHRVALEREQAGRREETGRLSTQLRNMGEAHATALKEKDIKHKEEIKTLETTHALKLEEERIQHAEKIKTLEENHASELQSERAQHHAAMKKADKKIDSLRVYLSRSTGADSYRPMPDDSFQGSFQQLAQRITNLVAVVSRPDPSRLSHEVDPTGFLARDAARGSSRGWPQFVRSICWAVLVRGFFSGPKGLGAFGGPGTYGHALANHLTDLLKVSQDESGRGVGKQAAASDVDKVDATRAELFAAFIAGLRRHIDENSYVHAIRANVQVVADELFASLQRVSSTSLTPSARNDLAGIAESTAVLALEMGSQRAQWMLETCQHGETVVTGERFRDADSTWDSGSIMVEFMTLPCLTRVGDGRKDASARVIVKGEFVPKRIDRIV